MYARKRVHTSETRFLRSSCVLHARVSDLVERNESVAVEVVQIEGGADLVIATATAEDRQPARKLGEIHDAIA